MYHLSVFQSSGTNHASLAKRWAFCKPILAALTFIAFTNIAGAQTSGQVDFGTTKVPAIQKPLTMIGGSANVAIDSPSTFGQLYLGDDTIVPYLRQLADRVHAHRPMYRRAALGLGDEQRLRFAQECLHLGRQRVEIAQTVEEHIGRIAHHA